MSEEIERVLDDALRRLDLDEKVSILAGQDMWSLPAIEHIGLGSVVMSDGPVGVRGVRWRATDHAVALPCPTALAATWDPDLVRTAGRLLAQEARDKGVHVLLAPTINLHRSPLGGRHFECFSEDPVLTAEIATGYVLGVQDGGVATTPKHFVANDSETERFTLDAVLDERTLRELYLYPFERLIAGAHPWGLMSAYNGVNGTTMTENAVLQHGILREEWGFDGFLVSDWTAARDGLAAANGGLDVAMPGPHTVFDRLAELVRSGEVAHSTVDEMARRVLRLAARVGRLRGAPPAVPPGALPGRLDGPAVARELAARSFVLVRNDNHTLPLRPSDMDTLAVLGPAATDARVLGGGSAQVYPERVISPLAGIEQAVGDRVTVRTAVGARHRSLLPVAADGFELRALVRDPGGATLGEVPLADGEVKWIDDCPLDVRPEQLHTVEITGTCTPRTSGRHQFAISGLGRLRLEIAGRVLFDGERSAPGEDPFTSASGAGQHRVEVELEAGVPVPVRLHHVVFSPLGSAVRYVSFALRHAEPEPPAEDLLAEAVSIAGASEAAVVVVGTTEEVESEGFDRADLALPGRQDELVSAVAAVNPNTVVVVNAGSPVEMPWFDEVAAVLLVWFPGQEFGAALADVLCGHTEPGGRLPTTWPLRERDAPVRDTRPVDGVLRYQEGVFIGYRAYQRDGVRPALWFGSGSGYTSWEYRSVRLDAAPVRADGPIGAVRVRVRNTGERAGREVVQVYLGTVAGDGARPARWLAATGVVYAEPGQDAEAVLELPRHAVRFWSEPDGAWRIEPGSYWVEVGRSAADIRLTTELVVTP